MFLYILTKLTTPSRVLVFFALFYMPPVNLVNLINMEKCREKG